MRDGGEGELRKRESNLKDAGGGECGREIERG